jgi:hypothetical protein
MKRYVQEMSQKDRRSWREWQTWWTCFYAVVIAALIGVGYLVPRSVDTELAQAAPTAHPGVPVHIGLK